MESVKSDYSEKSESKKTVSSDYSLDQFSISPTGSQQSIPPDEELFPELSSHSTETEIETETKENTVKPSKMEISQPKEIEKGIYLKSPLPSGNLIHLLPPVHPKNLPPSTDFVFYSRNVSWTDLIAVLHASKKSEIFEKFPYHLAKEFDAEIFKKLLKESKVEFWTKLLLIFDVNDLTVFFSS
jgi:hypothetical protein